MLNCFSCVRLFTTLWSGARQAPLFMGFSRQEYWSFPSPGDLPNPGIQPRSPALQADSLPSEPPGKPMKTGVGSLSLLQGIFPNQGSNPGLLHCRQILYQLSHWGSPRRLEWVAYPFSSGSARPRNRTGVFWIAGGFFTSWVTRALFPVLYNKTLLLVAYLFKVIIDILHAFRLYHFQIVHKRAVFRERFL